MKILRLLYGVLLFSQLAGYSAESAITYGFSGGRFGDNLVSYAHAKWVSYAYDIPLLYKPFPFSDTLVLDSVELYYMRNAKKFKAVETIYNEQAIVTSPGKPTLYLLPYFSEFEHERAENTKWPYIPVQWNDPPFRAQLKALIKPKAALPQRDLPENCIRVAAHVRRGRIEIDDVNGQINHPLRFPPNQFYIDQIHYLYHLYNQQPLYVYLFTDDKKPEVIAQTFEKGCEGLDIHFDYDKNVTVTMEKDLGDFFFMSKFDCMIRPQSNFSFVAALLGDFQVVIYPVHFAFTEGRPFIDQVIIQTQES